MKPDYLTIILKLQAQGRDAEAAEIPSGATGWVKLPKGG